MMLRGVQGPILARALQDDAPAEDRASVLSLNAMLFRTAFVIGGPPVGLLVERVGLSQALAILGPVLSALALAALAAFSHAHGPEGTGRGRGGPC